MNTDITNDTTASSVTAFNGAETAPKGMRVVSLHWKERKATDTKPAVAKRASVSCIVPSIIIAAFEPACLLDAVQDAIDEAQDSLVRSLVESGSTLIPHDAVNAVAVAAYCAAVATSKRLNKPAILQWFDSSLQDKVIAKITAVLVTDPSKQTDADVTKIIAATEVYRSQFAELAAPKPTITLSNAEKLLAWAQQSEQKDSVYDSIVSKLNVITKRTDVEILI